MMYREGSLTPSWRVMKMLPRVCVLLMVASVLLAVNNSAHAAACTAAASTAWNVLTTWGATGCAGASDGVTAGIPGAADTVSIGVAGTPRAVTVPAGYTARAASIAIGGTGTNGVSSLTLSANTSVLTVGGAVTVSAPNNNNINGLIVNAGTASMASFSATGGVGKRISQLEVSTGTATVTGNITFAGTAANAVITFSSTGTLQVGGTFGNGGTFTASTGTVEYNGSGAQTVNNTYSYNNLTLSGSGTKTPAAGTTTIAGNFTLATGVTYDGAANNPAVNLAGNFSNSGSFNSGNGQFTFNGTAAQGITGVTTFANLAVSNTAAAVTANSAITVAGTLTLAASSNLADGGNTITANGNISNAGSHTGAGRILLTGGAAAHALSGGGSYANLEVNDAFGATLSANATVNGTLTFTSGNLSTSTNTLTVGSAGVISGATTSRHVVGNLEKVFSAATAFTYGVGDGTNYTPLTVTFSAAVTGNLTASVTNTDHPNTTAGSSGIDSSKSINRYWTLKGSTVNGTYTAAFNYIDSTPAERDAAATAANFNIRRGTTCSGSGAGRTCTSWGALTVSGVPSNTLATATGVTLASGDPEADFAVGELSPTKFSREQEFIFTRERY